MAREVVESEIANAELLKKQKTNADRRGQDALLREKIRRDYQNMMQNLEHLSREERKLKASQIHEPPVIILINFLFFFSFSNSLIFEKNFFSESTYVTKSTKRNAK